MRLLIDRDINTLQPQVFPFFFFNDTATTEIYTLSLHDALPICSVPRITLTSASRRMTPSWTRQPAIVPTLGMRKDRKSTRLNSSHQIISYAVFCLKKKKSRRCTG